MITNPFLLIGLPKEGLTPSVQSLIEGGHLLGVILFARNFDSIEAMQTLCQQLQSAQAAAGGLPLLIGTDYEGGFVTRFDEAIPWIPTARAQARGGHPAMTEQLYAQAAGKLGQMGINCNLAPVLDVLPLKGESAIATRSFGPDPETVIQFGRAAWKGIHSAGLLATGKHFPGLGHAFQDSHDTLPFIDTTESEFRERDLAPFETLCKEGLPLLMTAHARYTALGPPDEPTPFHSGLYQHLLRDTWNYQGLVITDDLGMGAIRKFYQPAEAVVKALSAGADGTMLCHLPDSWGNVVQAVTDAVQQGQISSEQLKQSRARKEALLQSLPTTPSSKIAGGAPGKSLIQAISHKAMRPYSRKVCTPVSERQTVLLAPATWSLSEVESGAHLTQQFISEYHTRYGPLIWLPLESESISNEKWQALENANRKILICHRSSDWHQWSKRNLKTPEEMSPWDLGILVKSEAVDGLVCDCHSIVVTLGFHGPHQETLLDWMDETLAW